MDIFVLRHGDANPATKKLMNDSRRGLSDSGIKEIENVSELFARFEIRFDCIYSSPLRRAKQSTDIISKNQKKSKVIELSELKPEGSVESFTKKD